MLNLEPNHIRSLFFKSIRELTLNRKLIPLLRSTPTNEEEVDKILVECELMKRQGFCNLKNKKKNKKHN